jgi:hypothetical protein
MVEVLQAATRVLAGVALRSLDVVQVISPPELLALMVVLDTLTPAERVALVLHDMFAVPLRGDRAYCRKKHAGCPPAR